nr:site-specific DNA-methyltransferase [uncultured Desulfobacter sp.]
MEKMDGKTMDIVAENVGKLKELFPEAFTEGKVDFEALKEVLGTFVDDRDERYSFTWNGKSKARMIAQTPSTGTLRPCKEESVDWDSTQNIFIEGDNLEVLKLLQKSYHKKVKMIYIDPPYNTGSEFIYPDKWQDNLDTYLRYTGQVDDEGFKISANAEAGGRYHTNWLNMIYPRLKLARNLLRDDGAIFVSIDDHEGHNLRQVMDEVFGSENFVDTVIWQKIFTVKNSAKYFSAMHDYVVVYARAKDQWERNLLPRSAELDASYTNPDNDSRGPWTTNAVQARNYYGQGLYEIISPAGETFTPPPGTYWRVSRESFDKLDADGRIWWGKDGTNTPRIKKFLSEAKQGVVPSTLWLHADVGTNAEAKKELLERVQFKKPETVFDTPKPTRLIQHMLRIGSEANADDLIVDFFAGSGSAGEAVVRLNSEDGGNRRYLLVQLPEQTGAKDYATISEITKARLRAAAKAIAEETSKKLPGISANAVDIDLGFKVFKLDSTNIKPWEVDFEMTERTLEDFISNIKTDRREEDVLYEVLLKYGLDLTLPITEHAIAGQKVFDIGMGALIICLSDAISLGVVEGIAKLKDELNPEIMRVVFKDSGFKDDVVKTNAVQILKQAGIVDVRSL